MGGEKLEYGRGETGIWEDRNWNIEGEKLEYGRVEMECVRVETGILEGRN